MSKYTDFWVKLGYKKVTSDYGMRIHPIKKEKIFHQGIDVVIADKAPLKAIVGGEVVFAEMGKPGSGFGNYGNVVAIKDKNGRLHVYAHLDSIKVKKGVVKAGEIVGTQGNTGASAGSHLHFEIRKKASPSFGFITDKEAMTLNPSDYLQEILGESEIEMKAETANAIIKYLSEAYKEADKAEQDTIHKLANELRKISGQPLK